MAEQAHPALNKAVDDLQDEEFDDQEEDGLVIVKEGEGSATRRRVRFVMPGMVEVDCDADTVTRVVTLPEEIRDDRNDLCHFCGYDEQFLRRHDDDQPQTHAFNIARPE